MKTYKLKISGIHYSNLKNHLFPGDNKEAVSIALCGRNIISSEEFLLVHKIINIPYSECSIRKEDLVVWSTDLLQEHLPDIVKYNWAVVKIHSHPNGFESFSSTDDNSDKELFKSIYGWTDIDFPHGSMIMFSDGSLKGRIITPDLEFKNIETISVIGDDLQFFRESIDLKSETFSFRTEQAFGKGTVNLLKSLKIAVIGCSGTGSPVIEQLVRLGVGNLVLIDPDIIEEKNLNRIINSTYEDVASKRKKVDMMRDAINGIGLQTNVKTFSKNIFDDIEIVSELSSCDIMFGCVDSVDGRHVLNQIATFYLVGYFDLGVKLIADGSGGISQICGTIHYIQPGGSSLLSRGLYNYEELRAAGLYRTNEKEFEEQKKNGYIVNLTVDSPAVISINMYASSIAVNELLARIHKFRFDKNANFAITQFSNTDSYIMYDEDGDSDLYLQKFVGRGNITPVLNMAEFSSHG